ncbi:MAG: ArnT family glycosyltransferase [Bacteroidota bacterium]
MRYTVCLLLVLSLAAVLGLACLTAYPRPWVDEPWEAITGYNLATTGRLANPVLEGRDGYDRHFLEPRIFQSLVLAVVFRLGGVGLLQARLASIVFSILSLVVFYFLMRRISSEWVAIVSTLLLSVDNLFFIASRQVRPEIYLVMFSIGTLWILAEAIVHQRLLLIFLAGILAGVSVWVHPNGLAVPLAGVLILLGLYSNVRKVFQKFAFFTVGGFLGFLPYAIYVIYQDFGNHFQNWWAQLAGRPQQLMQSFWLIMSARGEWQRFLQYVAFPYRVVIVAVSFLAVVTLIFYHKRYNQLTRWFLITPLVAYMVIFFFLNSNKTIHYMVLLSPWLAGAIAAVAGSALGSFTAWRGSTLHSFIVIAMCAAFLNSAAGDVALIYRNRNCDYEQTLAALRAAIPFNARVWGSMTFWFAFYNQPYRTQYTYVRDLSSFKPDYVIANSVDIWGKSAYDYEHWAGVRQAIDSLLLHQGSLNQRIYTQCYGTLDVYSISWHTSTSR